MYRNCKVGVSIPAFNEEKHIEEAITAIPNYIDSIVVVDDFSADKTYEKSNKVARLDNRIKVIKHTTNKGVVGSIISAHNYNFDVGNCEIVVENLTFTGLEDEETVVENLTFTELEDEETDDFGDYFRKWGLRFYSNRPFRSVWSWD